MNGRLLLIGLFLACFSQLSFSQTAIEGVVLDDNDEPVPFATVVVLKNDVEVTGTETDLDGYYSLSNIDPGTYDLEFSSIGYQAQMVTGIVALAGKTTSVDGLITKGITTAEVVIKEYSVPLVEQDNTTQGSVVTGKEIQNLPIKNINAIAATTAGASSIDNGDISIRGSRTGNTVYIIDGVRVVGRMIPQSEIEQLQIMTGGIPANVGDVTGGVVSATSKGPSQKFTGGIELETSHYLDPYGYKLASGNLSGPILKNSDGNSIIGFRVSGQYRRIEDDNPSYVPRYYASEEALDEIAENPLFEANKRIFNSGETLRSEAEGGQVIEANSRPNDDNETLDLTGKIDFKLFKGFDLSVSGSYFNGKNRFTGNYARRSFSLLNWDRNPYQYRDGYRVNARIRHRLGGGYEQGAESGGGFIRNVSYTLQAGFENSNSRVEDFVHEDRLFNYGYIGKYNTEYEAIFAAVDGANSPNDSVTNAVYVPFGEDIGAWVRNADYGEREEDVYFEPNYDINPILARMNEFNELTNTNGQFSNITDNVWELYANRGSVYNSYTKNNNQLYSGRASINFDLFPSGSEKGRHNIELGFLYEQRVYRNYAVAPVGLWQTARNLINERLSGVDTLTTTGETGVFTINGQDIEVPLLLPQLDQDVIDGKVKDGFFLNFRKAYGIENTEYVTIDEYSPEALNLEMFAPHELTDNNLMGYYGYDYLGNPVGTSTTFEDYFNVNSDRNRPVAPFTPIYYAGYIQDKFSYKDLIMRLGLRADFYDANTKVLRDQQSLYPILTANEFHEMEGGEKPGSIGDDFKVYTQSPEGSEAYGYRDGEVWYDAEGNEIQGTELWGTSAVHAAYSPDLKSISDDGFDVNGSFKDYETQINISPRLAFSFPISDEANFFAHYDILTQRPARGNSYVSPQDYYYFEVANRAPIANAALKPNKTVDYEVGFQQKVSNSSAIKIAAYYKEERDLIQRRTLLYLPGNNTSRDVYDNIDFGTIYGFSFSYDLRRTGNIQLKAGYTLQFARGTGSNADSQQGLTQRGNLRNLFYLNQDERHRFTVNLDYRFGSGTDYNGPKIGKVNLFANTGLNLQANVVSGRPYTAQQSPTILGGSGIASGINENRYPWVFALDGRLDKNIKLNSNPDKRPLFLNVYLRAQNIFNVENVIGLYRYSRSTEDPGYLTSAPGARKIVQYETGTRPLTDADVDAFLDAYSWARQNPGFYTLPRRLYFGVIFQF